VDPTALCGPYCPLWALLPSVACPDLQYFSTLFHKRHDFGGEKKTLLNTNVCFDFLYKIYLNLSESYLTLRRTERDMMKNVCWFSYKIPVIIVGF
jgi:hypothetical protein